MLSSPPEMMTALHAFAVKGQDVKALELLLNSTKTDGVKPDINVREATMCTPLHMLLYFQQDVPKPLLRAFIEHGADVNAEDDQSKRPLQMACSHGDLETLQILCQDKSITEINDQDDKGATALLTATNSGNLKLVQYLIELGADLDVCNYRGSTALFLAARYHETKEGVELLLANGASLDILDTHNRSAFFSACCHTSTEETARFLLDTLLEKKVPLAEINRLTKRRRSPLREAASHGVEYVVETLIKTAQASNDLASLALDEQDTRKGMTPLHRAAWLGKNGCVRLLLGAKANPALKDNNGKTALELTYERWALESHEEALEDIISLLIDADNSAAAADAELVAICAIHGSLRLLRQLLGIGADLNCPDQYGWTPLDLAQKCQHKELSRYLKQQVVWAGRLPSRWSAAAAEDNSNSSSTDISPDGLTVKHKGGFQLCLAANKPVPAGLDKFYYEITIQNLTSDHDPDSPNPATTTTTTESPPCVVIGFSNTPQATTSFDLPGWPPRKTAFSARSWGYHGDDGSLMYASRNDEEEEVLDSGLPYAPGMTVGCGVDFAQGRMWLTREGRLLKKGFANVFGRLFPLVGLEDGVCVWTNFQGPFLWRGVEGCGGVRRRRRVRVPSESKSAE